MYLEFMVLLEAPVTIAHGSPSKESNCLEPEIIKLGRLNN